MAHIHPLLKQDQSTALFVELSLWTILAQNSYGQKIADYMLSLLTQNRNGIALFCMPTKASNALTEISEFDIIYSAMLRKQSPAISHATT